MSLLRLYPPRWFSALRAVECEDFRKGARDRRDISKPPTSGDLLALKGEVRYFSSYISITYSRKDLSGNLTNAPSYGDVHARLSSYKQPRSWIIWISFARDTVQVVPTPRKYLDQ